MNSQTNLINVINHDMKDMLFSTKLFACLKLTISFDFSMLIAQFVHKNY